MIESIEVQVERDAEDLVVRSPRVGIWCDPPPAGRSLGPGSEVGTLVQLTRRYRLVLPDGARGIVADGVSADRRGGVEHGQALLRLREVVVGDPSVAGTGAEAAGGGDADDLARNVRPVVAPTDGVFYRRASPDAPPFVEVGDRVSRGQTVGLVEVMKTFNQILYGGPGLPDEAEVLEIRCHDAQEVTAGATLILVSGGD